MLLTNLTQKPDVITWSLVGNISRTHCSLSFSALYCDDFYFLLAINFFAKFQGFKFDVNCRERLPTAHT